MGSAYQRHFTGKDLYNVWPSVTGFFDRACFQHPWPLEHVWLACFFLWLCHWATCCPFLCWGQVKWKMNKCWDTGQWKTNFLQEGPSQLRGQEGCEMLGQSPVHGGKALVCWLCYLPEASFLGLILKTFVACLFSLVSFSLPFKIQIAPLNFTLVVASLGVFFYSKANTLSVTQVLLERPGNQERNWGREGGPGPPHPGTSLGTRGDWFLSSLKPQSRPLCWWPKVDLSRIC